MEQGADFESALERVRGAKAAREDAFQRSVAAEKSRQQRQELQFEELLRRAKETGQET